jgi:hypothetical protein
MVVTFKVEYMCIRIINMSNLMHNYYSWFSTYFWKRLLWGMTMSWNVVPIKNLNRAYEVLLKPHSFVLYQCHGSDVMSECCVWYDCSRAIARRKGVCVGGVTHTENILLAKWRILSTIFTIFNQIWPPKSPPPTHISENLSENTPPCLNFYATALVISLLFSARGGHLNKRITLEPLPLC